MKSSLAPAPLGFDDGRLVCQVFICRAAWTFTAASEAARRLLQVAAGKIDKDSDMAQYLKLSGEDLDALTKVHIFGYKGTGPICGPDIHCLGSLRCTCKKSAMRVVLSVALSSAQVAVAKWVGKDD